MRTSRSVTTPGIILFLVVVGVSPAFGCDFEEPPPPRQAAEQADAVFAGTVTGIESVGDVDVLATFEVTRVWRGPSTATVEVTTPENPGMCGFAFEVDRNYLVYANERDGDLQTSIATRTTDLEAADEDLQALGQGDQPDADDGRALWPLPVAAVTLAIFATVALVRRSRRAGVRPGSSS